jgi:hypothetical protein
MIVERIMELTVHLKFKQLKLYLCVAEEKSLHRKKIIN